MVFQSLSDVVGLLIIGGKNHCATSGIDYRRERRSGPWLWS